MIRKIFLPVLSVICICCFLLSDCKRPFEPTLKSSDKSFLVAEGFIDGGAISYIHLSRVRNITPGDIAPVNNELNAHVSIEDDHQNTYTLSESGDGIYATASVLPLDPTHQYHVHIATSNGKEYLSDFVPFKTAPAIDTIDWKLKDGGVQLYLSSHDNTNLSKYYRWDYTETWEFHVFYHSDFKYDEPSNMVVPRTEQVYTCWHSDNATSILLGNTAKLSSDVVNQAPIAFIENHAQKLSVLYSILVKQFTLDANAYNYWLAMKANTENTGSIFDPQPNESPGNIRCISNPSERVIGFISAGSTTEKRIFINGNVVPLGWNLPQDCHDTTIADDSLSRRRYFAAGGLAPIAKAAGGYESSYADCVDCTITGTNIKPSFWP